MDPIFLAGIGIVVLLILIFLGVHISAALIIVSTTVMWLMMGTPAIALNALGMSVIRGVMEYIFGTLPLFIVMGLLANQAGSSHDLYDAAGLLLRRVKGGLAIATVLANAIFAAVTGASVVSASVFSKIAMPQMMRLGYDKKLALGTVAGSSILGMLIPPSLLLIIYGVLTEESVGKLFIAGVLPGLLMTAIFSAGIIIIVKLRPNLVKSVGDDAVLFSRQSFKIIIKPWPIGLLILLVLGGIYGGFTTPTEAGAIGGMGGLALVLLKRRFTLKSFWETLVEVGIMNTIIGFLVISALFFSKMLAFTGFTSGVTEWIISFGLPPLVVIWVFIFAIMIMGSFLDSTSILLITVPLFAPIVQGMGFDLIWFGIVVLVATELGLLTPPFGMVVFAVKAALGDEVTVEEIFAGSFPFFLMMIVALAIIVHVPWLSTFLPGQM